MKLSRTSLIVPLCLAIAFGASACQSEEPASVTPETLQRSPLEINPALTDPMPESTLIGCLQEVDGAFVLTTAEAADLASGREPQTAELRSARRTYRLIGEAATFDGHTDHSVRVTGLITEPTEVPAPDPVADDAESSDAGTSAAGGEGDMGGDIDVSDLAELAVTSIETVAEACGATPSG